MRHQVWLVPLLLVTALLALSSGPARVVYAASPGLELQVGSADDGAARVPLKVRLTDNGGRPTGGARIVFLVDGERDGEARTDADGQATWRIRRSLAAGDHTVEAVAPGPPALSASARFAVTAAQIALELSSPAPQVGDRLSMAASVTDGAGAPLAGATIKLLLNGARAGEARTDEQGHAVWPLGRSLTAGDYQAEAVFDGRLPALPTRARQSFTVTPAQLEIRTAPALPGTSFTLNGRAFTAGQDGVARISVERTGVYSLTVTGGDTLSTGVRSEFTGWDDDVFTTDRSIQIPAKGPLEAGFDVYYLVTPKFTGPSGEAVDPQRISLLTLTSSIGRRVNLTGVEPTWIQGSHVVAGPEHLEERPITYTVESVVVDGANVVNQGQQRFLPGVQQDLPIGVFLYSIHLSARDALFGIPVTSGVYLTYPDGQTRRVALGPDGRAVVNSLARGEYRVKLDGRGLGTARPLVLSRDLDVPIMLISYLDLGVVLGALGSLALSLLLLGRRTQWMELLRRARRRPALSPGQPQERAPERETLGLLED